MSHPHPRPQYIDHVLGKMTFTVDARYQSLHAIGRGAYGFVASADDVVLGRKVAIKRIAHLFQDLIDAKRVLREIKLLRHMSHDNVVKLLHIMTGPPDVEDFHTLYIVTDLYECDLERIITSSQALTETHTQYFVFQLLKGLKYVHSMQALHRDLKPSNVLVNANCDLAICDFGLARGYTPVTALTHAVVTRWYRAPELLCEELKYGPPLDMWALGCIFAEIVLRKPLFPGGSNREQLELIIAKLGTPSQRDASFVTSKPVSDFLAALPRTPSPDWGALFPKSSPAAVDLISKMLTFDPARRISAEDALRHPFLSSVYTPLGAPVCSTQFDGSFENGYEGTTEMPVPILQAFMREEMLSLQRSSSAAASAAAYASTPLRGAIGGAGAM